MVCGNDIVSTKFVASATSSTVAVQRLYFVSDSTVQQHKELAEDPDSFIVSRICGKNGRAANFRLIIGAQFYLWLFSEKRASTLFPFIGFTPFIELAPK